MIKYAIMAIGVVILAILLIFLKRSHSKNAKNKAMAVQAEDKLREEALDRILLNENARSKGEETFSAKPFEVSYDAQGTDKRSAGQGKKKKRSSVKVMLQITEKSELSVRKYMFDPSSGVRIGSKKGKNNIVVTDPQVDEMQCELLEHEGVIYIRNVGGSGKVVLTRGGQRAYVEQKAVVMKSGDEILLGKTVFQVDLVKADAT